MAKHNVKLHTKEGVDKILDCLEGIDTDDPQINMDLMFVAVSSMYLAGFEKGSIHEVVFEQVKIVENIYNSNKGE
jgi:hypothetical protein